MQAREGGFDSLWLGVWDQNRGAIAFYQREGFTQVGEYAFMLGNDRQNDLLLERPLE